MLRCVSRPGVVVAGILALLAGGFLIVGILLPGTVEVTRSVDIDASPEAVFPLVNDLEAWTEWTPWGDLESELEGPAAGVGARRVWDDAAMGSGTLTLVVSRPPLEVGYEVEVEDGAIRFEGTISIQERSRGSLVSWTERVELGWNPLLGWTALTMDESQGLQLQESLERLKERAESGG
ncbi:MAG: SRPBCC family protein [Gemmatimonadetes bacterium]|nr:SRPBCC family protein [Gemmatimonadota bacterium]